MTKSTAIHHESPAIQNTSVPDPHQDLFSKATVGFWIYLMTDCLLFGSLFAAYAVLHKETFGGPGPKELYNLRTAIWETAALLLSSVTCGMGMLAACRSERKKVFIWFTLAFLFGLSFVGMELNEFTHLVHEGNSWRRSAFLTSFFSLVGTHGTHVSIGLL